MSVKRSAKSVRGDFPRSFWTVSRAPSRAMLYPIGFKEADFKPQVGVAST
jgi:hypothetical protein